ncbi:DUF4097 family beta strand repeat-containing protein [Amycolatopsis pigmentata]|uniref:DUF4097 domain-containing protein n=1 Tax=Amycolatopsis pigmentata TaxID=450801 RepID=A0ABW5G043_9PSEU
MPTFATPEPISATIDLVVGDVHLIAGERDTTTVEVRPSDASHAADKRVAEQTKVEYAAGQLRIKAPRQHGLGIFGRPGSIEVTIGLPAGSNVHGGISVGAFRAEGRLGECWLKTSVGNVDLDQAGFLDAKTSGGTVGVDHVAGDAEVSTASGRVRLGVIEGTAMVKNSNGDTWIGEVTGEARISASNGDIAVDHAGAGITATTANGHVRIGEVVRGASTLKTAVGEIEIGLRAGTAAELDVSTRFGKVRNQLDVSAGPEPSDETAKVLARTSFGDILIRRS